MAATTKWTPTLGYALVRKIESGMTPSGLHVPDTKTSAPRLCVVESSRGHHDYGTFIESPLKPGDVLVVTPGTKLASVVGMPDGHYFCRLVDVVAFEREDRAN